MKLAYYAHPITEYGTTLESVVMKHLEKCGFMVINPNNPITELEYRVAKSTGGFDKAMRVFYNLIDRCDVLAFTPFRDGMISSGVKLELEYAIKADKPVLEVPFQHLIKGRYLSYEDTLARIKECKK